jgi:predicted transcriptional regulator
MTDRERSRHRSECRIIADVLKAIQASEEAKVTHILHSANLSYDRLIGYLDQMESAGLVTKGEANGSALYLITKKGLEYLAQFRKFEEFGDIFGVRI